jgi:hypothetical protein
MKTRVRAVMELFVGGEAAWERIGQLSLLGPKLPAPFSKHHYSVNNTRNTESPRHVPT